MKLRAFVAVIVMSSTCFAQPFRANFEISPGETVTLAQSVPNGTYLQITHISSTHFSLGINEIEARSPEMLVLADSTLVGFVECERLAVFSGKKSDDIAGALQYDLGKGTGMYCPSGSNPRFKLATRFGPAGPRYPSSAFVTVIGKFVPDQRDLVIISGNASTVEPAKLFTVPPGKRLDVIDVKAAIRPPKGNGSGYPSAGATLLDDEVAVWSRWVTGHDHVSVLRNRTQDEDFRLSEFRFDDTRPLALVYEYAFDGDLAFGSSSTVGAITTIAPGGGQNLVESRVIVAGLLTDE